MSVFDPTVQNKSTVVRNCFCALICQKLDLVDATNGLKVHYVDLGKTSQSEEEDSQWLFVYA